MAQPSPLLSPPAEEAEVHDPFVVHHSDEESGSDGAAAESDPAPAVSEPSSSTGPTPSAEISLTPTTGQSPAAPPALALPTVAIPSPSPLRTATSLPPASPLNVNKDVPAPPEETSDESSSDELPPLFVPTLVLPQLFLPIPNACHSYSHRLLPILTIVLLVGHHVSYSEQSPFLCGIDRSNIDATCKVYPARRKTAKRCDRRVAARRLSYAGRECIYAYQ